MPDTIGFGPSGGSEESLKARHHRFRVVLWKGSDPGGRDLGHRFTTENGQRMSGICKNSKNRNPLTGELFPGTVTCFLTRSQ